MSKFYVILKCNTEEMANEVFNHLDCEFYPQREVTHIALIHGKPETRILKALMDGLPEDEG